MRGITLEEIAKATRIGTRLLRALEQEDFGKLPGGIFNKGFVRAYARYLGIDEEQAVSDYLAALGEPDDPTLDGERLKKLEVSWKPPRRNRLSIDPYFRMPWRGLALVVIIIIVLLLAWQFRHGSQAAMRSLRTLRQSLTARPPAVAQPPAPVAAPTAPAPEAAPGREAQAVAEPAPSAPAAATSASVAEPAAKPAGKDAASGTKPDGSGTKPASSRAADANTSADTKKGQPFTLRVRTRKESWISIEADGQPKARGMMDAGKEKTIIARNRVKLIAGDAAALEVFLNGKKQPSLGSANEVRTVFFTADGMVAPAPAAN
jgi:cytoskeletal protein RodZ